MFFLRMEVPSQHKYNFRLKYERDLTPQECVHENFSPKDFTTSLPTLHTDMRRRAETPSKSNVASTPAPSPQYLWFPTNLPKGPRGPAPALVPPHALPNSPRYAWSQQAVTARRKLGTDLSKFVNTSLSSVAKPILAMTSSDSTLTFRMFAAALAEAGCPDEGMAAKLMSDFDLFGENAVRVYVVIPALHSLILGKCHDVVTERAFQLLDRQKLGYIIKANIVELRAKRKLNAFPGLTPEMVKSVMDAFNTQLKEEEQSYLETVILKGKGRKKKKPPAMKPTQKSYIPLDYKVKQHLTLDEFRKYVRLIPSVVSAFLPNFLDTMLDVTSVHAQVHEDIKVVVDEVEAKNRPPERTFENAEET